MMAHAILSTENLRHNVQVLRKKIGRAKLIAMVKANAYGHGLRSVALRLSSLVDLFGVARLHEAWDLRQAGIQTPILLAEGCIGKEELTFAIQERFHVVVHSFSQIQDIEDTMGLSASSPMYPLHIWIKINTGMNRLGFRPHELPEASRRLSQCKGIATPLRILSHFACADDPSHPLNAQQMLAFQHSKDLLSQELETYESSFCNSAALFAFPQWHETYVRPGLSLYGISPFSEHIAENLDLKPVMTLRSSLIAIQSLSCGESIGYGARSRCTKDMRLGVVAIGYGDGFPISASDGTPVLIHGIRCPVIGRISMDMMTVDLSAVPQANIGDLVTLWGEDPLGHRLPVEHIATYAHTIPYDLITGVLHRVKFFWTPYSNTDGSS